jgi:hypothetical protein
MVSSGAAGCPGAIHCRGFEQSICQHGSNIDALAETSKIQVMPDFVSSAG